MIAVPREIGPFSMRLMRLFMISSKCDPPSLWRVAPVGVAVASVAAGLWWWSAPEASGPSVEARLATVRASDRLASLSRGRGDGDHSSPGAFDEVNLRQDAGEPPERPAPLVVLRGPEASTAAKPAVTDAEVWASYEPTREELEYRARVVEARADKELRNLLRVVPLDEARQDRVFAALVQSSDWYHPALQASGSSGTPLAISGATRAAAPASGDSGTPAPPPGVPPAVVAELSADEADVYSRYTSERAAFWVGVIEDVEQQLRVSGP